MTRFQILYCFIWGQKGKQSPLLERKFNVKDMFVFKNFENYFLIGEQLKAAYQKSR